MAGFDLFGIIEELLGEFELGSLFTLILSLLGSIGGGGGTA